MNWNNIEVKYPKAFNKWKEWAFYHRTQEIGRIRRLYDFFDKQKIVISIVWVMHTTEDRLEYYYDFAIDNIASFESDKHYATRTEAEEKAFEKAFEILENKL